MRDPWEKTEGRNPWEGKVPAPKEGWKKASIRAGLSTLPVVGGAGAAMLSAETGPGAIPAGAAGYAAGKQAEKLGKEYFLNEYDRAQNPIDLAKEVGGDAVEGAAVEAGGQAATKAVAAATPYVAAAGAKVARPIKSLMDNFLKKTGYGILKIPEETTERYLANPEAVRAAGTIRDEVEALPGVVDEMRGNAKKLSGQARNTLSRDRTGETAQGLRDKSNVSLDDVYQILDQHAGSSPGVRAVRDNVMKNAQARVNSDAGAVPSSHLTEDEVRGLIDDIKQYTDFNKQLPSSDYAAANQAHGRLNSLLKEQNPLYKDTMEETARTAGARNRVIQKFGLERDPTGPNSYKTSDRTVTAGKDLTRADKLDRRQLLEDIEALGYPDVGKSITNALDKAAFTKDATNGSRLVNLGRAIGRVGGKPGEIIGGYVGTVADRFGTAGFRRAVDAKIGLERMLQAGVPAEYAGRLLSGEGTNVWDKMKLLNNQGNE